MKKILVLGLLLAFGFSLILPTGASAQTLEEQIRALQAQIQTLQSQLQTLVQSSGSSSAVSGGTSVSPATITRNLYFGLTNDSQVRILQEYLRSRGYLADEATGNFYNQTYLAVQAFQRANGIDPTGYVGTQTRGALSGGTSNLIAPPIDQTGSTGVISPDPLTVSLTASPNSINVGEGTKLTLTSSNARYCTGDPVNMQFWYTVPGNTGTNGYIFIAPTKTTTYSITCYRGITTNTESKSTNATVTVRSATDTIAQPVATTTAPQAPIVKLTASSTSIKAGESSILTLTTSGAKYCLGAGYSGNTWGSVYVYPTQTTTYTVTCYPQAYVSEPSSKASAIVYVGEAATDAAPTVKFYADPLVITSGQLTSFTWSSNAANCDASSIPGGAVAAKPNGYISLYPTQDTTYKITCYSSSGKATTASATVSVTTIAPAGAPVLRVESNVLKWGAVTGATGYNLAEIRASGRTYQPLSSGTVSFDPVDRPGETVRYAVRIDPNNDKWSNEVSITYSSIPPPNEQTVLTLTPSKTSIVKGEPVTLTWYATNATECTVPSAEGNLFTARSLPYGSVTYYPGQTITYQFTCFKEGAYTLKATKSVTITVGQPDATQVNPGGLTISLTASPNPITSLSTGTTITLATTNATFCDVTRGGSSIGFAYGATSGNVKLWPASTMTIEATCTNSAGQSTSKTLVVTVSLSTTLNTASYTDQIAGILRALNDILSQLSQVTN